MIESEYQKEKGLARETPNCLCKIAIKCIEMQLKIVNDFLTEIYISFPVDFKVVFVC